LAKAGSVPSVARQAFSARTEAAPVGHHGASVRTLVIPLSVDSASNRSRWRSECPCPGRFDAYPKEGEASLSEDPRLRHGRIKEILFEASLLGEDRRTAFLSEACAGDDAMRAEIESLLAYHDDAASEPNPRRGSACPKPSPAKRRATASRGGGAASKSRKHS
jgi:hypothetical protein